jgi:hypothetical protein
MREGVVPGTGNEDNVFRRLQAGAFVLKKDAVRKYGVSTLATLTKPIARFASGGKVSGTAAGPLRAVRVELAVGSSKVNATIDARDETQLIRLLEAAQRRSR